MVAPGWNVAVHDGQFGDGWPDEYRRIAARSGDQCDVGPLYRIGDPLFVPEQSNRQLSDQHFVWECRRDQSNRGLPVNWLVGGRVGRIFLLYRRLKFSSFDRTGARVNGVGERVVAVIFLLLVALSVSVAAQIVGSLLIFILLTLPAASAKYFTTGTAKMIGLAILFALTGTWTGLYLGYLTNWPVSFFIAVIEVGIYLAALANRHRQAD